MIGFPTPGPDGFVASGLAAGRSLAAAPTWDLDTVQVGPPRASPGYERHLQETFGSSYDWSDELRFARDGGELTSFVLKTPEAGTIDPGLAASWLALEPAAGLPVVEPRTTGFHVDPLDLRALSGDGRALVVLAGTAAAADAASVRLAVHPTFDLLFSAQGYVGWVLHDPLARLVPHPSAAVTAPGDPADPELLALLRDYLALVVEPNIELMSDQDAAIGAALRDVRQRAARHASRAAAARVIEHRLDDVLDTFFG